MSPRGMCVRTMEEEAFQRPTEGQILPSLNKRMDTSCACGPRGFVLVGIGWPGELVVAGSMMNGETAGLSSVGRGLRAGMLSTNSPARVAVNWG